VPGWIISRHGKTPVKRDGNCQIQKQDQKNRSDDGPGNHPLRLANLVPQVADVVVAEEVEHHQHGSIAQAEQERHIQVKGARREVEKQPRVQMHHAFHGDPEAGQQETAPKHQHDAGNITNLAIEQDHGNQGKAGGEQAQAHGRLDQSLEHETRIERHAHSAGGDLQGAAEKELPDEEPRHQAPQALPPEALAQVVIRAAGAGESGAQLGKNQAIRNGDQGSHKPANQGLRSAHGGENGRNRNKRSRAHHVGHVDGDGIEQAELLGQVDSGHEVGVESLI
jgi:hypothetical protein